MTLQSSAYERTHENEDLLALAINDIPSLAALTEEVAKLHPEHPPGLVYAHVAAAVAGLWERGYVVVDACEHIRGRLRLGAVGLAIGTLFGMTIERIA